CIADDLEGASWLRMHWRPLIAFVGIMGLILSGITLRYLAPGRFATGPRPAAISEPDAPPVTCQTECWTGEACQVDTCVWQRPNGVGHIAARPGIAGPFNLPDDFTDGILLDETRFAVGRLTGAELRSTRTGQPLGLISEASQTRQLLRAD